MFRGCNIFFMKWILFIIFIVILRIMKYFYNEIKILEFGILGRIWDSEKFLIVEWF